MTTQQENKDQVVGKQKLDPKVLNREVLVRSLEAQTQTKYEDDAPENDVIVTMLSAYYAKLPEEQLVQCNDCQGFSDANLEGCPFCGAADAPAETQVAAEPPAAKKSPLKKASATPKKEPEKEAPKNGVHGPAKAAPASASTTLAKTAPSAVALLYSEKDLDNAVVEISRLKGEGALSLWRLGKELQSVLEKELWRLRNNDEGKPKYKGWHQFVELECGLSKTQGYNWVEIARTFTEADVLKFGQRNLATVIAVPKDQQSDLLKRIATGGKDGNRMTTREVEDEVKKIKDRAGTKSRSKGKGSRDTTKAAQASAAVRAKRPTVTCMVYEGKQSVKLYTKDTAHFVDEEKRKRTKKLADGAKGVIECSNGVALHFAVQADAKGELILAVEARRKDD
jgi:hypothetical protein